jgi:drug/metabolite transporter (DMT)-like permease
MASSLNPDRKISFMADLGLFYAAAIWGSTFFLVKNALSGIDPVIMVGYRFLLAGIILSIYILLKRKNLFENLGKGPPYWKQSLPRWL